MGTLPANRYGRVRPGFLFTPFPGKIEIPRIAITREVIIIKIITTTIYKHNKKLITSKQNTGKNSSNKENNKNNSMVESLGFWSLGFRVKVGFFRCGVGIFKTAQGHVA